MGKGGGKGGKGRVAKFVGLAAGIAFGFGGGAWGFMKSVTSVFGRVMYGLSLGMSIGGLFDKQKSPSTPESTFDSKNNQVTSEGTVPVIYGQTKVGGLQTYHKMDVNGRKLEKQVVLCEGAIADIFGVTANGYLTSVKHAKDKDKQRNIRVFGLRNNKWKDAVVSVTREKKANAGTITFNEKEHPLFTKKTEQSIYQDGIDYKDFQKFPKLVLRAGGKETILFLTDDNTNIDPKYMLACNTFGKAYQIILGDTYLSDLQRDGWEIVDPVICQDSPSKLAEIKETPCYNTDVYFYTNGDQDAKESTVYTNLGESDSEPPIAYKTTGGYPNMAYVSADLRYTEKMGAGNPTITCIVRGRIVYDWRKGHAEYSKNPVVCLYDYLTNDIYGAGRYITPDILDMDSFTDVANYCDEIITYDDPYGVTKSEPRYQLDICLNETKTHLENIQSILNSFLGFIVFSNNKIKLRCERLEQPVYAFNDDNIIEQSLSYKSASIDQSPNKFNLTYVEPALDYTAVKLIVEDTTNQLPPPIGVGRPIEQDIEFKGVRRQTQCLRLGKIARDVIRLCPITVSFKTGLMASHLEAGDIVTVSKTYVDDNGERQELFTNQQVRITEIKEEDGTYEITARQYNPSIYDDAFGASLKVFAPTGDSQREINLLPATVQPVKNTSVEQVYRGKINGVATYDLLLQFDAPDDIEYRTSEVLVQIQRNGVTEPWKSYGESNGMLPVIGVQKNDIVNFKIIPIDSKYIGHDESAVDVTHKVIPKSGNPMSPQNVAIKFTDIAKVTFDRVTNADIESYEIRTTDDLTDNNTLGITTENSLEVNLKNRQGKVYVYAINSEGVYSSPTMVSYNVPIPDAPSVTIKELLQSFRVNWSQRPKPCYKSIVQIDGTKYDSDTNVFVYNDNGGVYNVSVYYVDYFGEGKHTNPPPVKIKATIDSSMLNKESLGLQTIENTISQLQKDSDKIKSDANALKTSLENTASGLRTEITTSAKGLLTKLQDTNNRVTEIKTSVNGIQQSVGQQIKDSIGNVQQSLKTEITQATNALELKVEQMTTGENLVAKINLSPAGTRIDGKLLHVTGQALFDDNIITNKMLQAKSVSADKLKVDSLSAITANVGNLHGGTITGATIKNDSGSFSVNNAGEIRGAKLIASTIDAASIYNSGYKLKNIDFGIVAVKHGHDCPPLANYRVDQCTFVPCGYAFTERVQTRTDRRDSNEYIAFANRRYNGKLSLVFYQTRGIDVGFNGRQAIVQAESDITNFMPAYTQKSLSFGVLYVLVIGKS